MILAPVGAFPVVPSFYCVTIARFLDVSDFANVAHFYISPRMNSVDCPLACVTNCFQAYLKTIPLFQICTDFSTTER